MSYCQLSMQKKKDYCQRNLFGRSDSEKLSNEICKTRFNAGEKCCNLIVSCLYYLQDNFSREERNTLIKNVNNKNKK